MTSQLEKILGFPIALTPFQHGDPARNVMPCLKEAKEEEHTWQALYALDEEGQLIGLNLAGRQLTDTQWTAVAETIDCSRLQALNLRNNQLRTVTGMEKMSALRYLDLTDNQLEQFVPPPNAAALEHIFLGGNKGLASPPPEVVAKGRYAIHSYLQALQAGGSTQLFEAKVLILGAGGVGKTTLRRKLLQGIKAEMPTEEESTHGIEVEDMVFKCPETDRFVAHIWDFGGQAIYQATHRFFLTKRSLYIVVADERKEDNNFNYWLQIIELLGSGSPVIIVQNEKGGRRSDIGINEIKQFFPNVIKHHSLNLSNDEQGLNKLRKDIEAELRRLEHVGFDWPKPWADIRATLGQLQKSEKKQTISLDTYLEIGEKHGQNEAEALRISDFLHDLGAILHFQDDPILKRIVVLDNDWAVSGVYQVVDHRGIQEKAGYFSLQDATHIWSDKTLDKYNAQFAKMVPEFIQLMLKFEICYRLPDTVSQQEAYLAPELRPVDVPEGVQSPDTAQLLQIRYQYTFMPKGIMSRLIVRLHRYIQDYKVDTWRSGAVFRREGALLRVEESIVGSRLSLRASGAQAKALVTIVSDEIDHLNAAYEKLKVDKLVPCNCAVCKNMPLQTPPADPNFYEYEDLMRRKNVGKATIECKYSYDNVNVLQLIDSVFVTTFFNPKSLRVFTSYSKADKEHRNRLNKHLSPFLRDGSITTWDDSELLPGDEWDKRIRHELATADVVLLLVSSDYLATEYVWKEIAIALERHEQGKAVVVPIIVRPCAWTDAPFARFNALPEKGKPITKWDNPDEAWTTVVEQIQLFAKKLTY
jgi:GTPase SAR1 family protein